MVLHIRIVRLFSALLWYVRYQIGMYVTERLLNTKVMVFLGFLWFAVWFSSKEGDLQ